MIFTHFLPPPSFSECARGERVQSAADRQRG